MWLYPPPPKVPSPLLPSLASLSAIEGEFYDFNSSNLPAPFPTAEDYRRPIGSDGSFLFLNEQLQMECFGLGQAIELPLWSSLANFSAMEGEFRDFNSSNLPVPFPTVEEILQPIGSDGSFLFLNEQQQIECFGLGQSKEAIGLPNIKFNPVPLEPPFMDQEGVVQEVDQTVCSKGRPDITLWERLHIAWRFWDPERPWGTVSQLASLYQLSRQSIYRIAHRAFNLLEQKTQGRPPTPLATNPTQVDKNVVAYSRSEKLQLRGRLILTALFPGGMTMRPLEELLVEVPGIGRVSDSTIWRLANQAATRAASILSDINYKEVNTPCILVAIDETFFTGTPIYLVVEPLSLAICGLYVPPDGKRDSDNWLALLDLLKNTQNLKIVGVVGDAATAYPKASRGLFGSKGYFQEDHFHLLMELKKWERRLEREAYTAFGREEKLARQRVKKPSLTDKWQAARLESNEKAHLYDNFTELVSWVNEGLQLVDWQTDQIRTHQESSWFLETAVSEMTGLSHPEMVKISQRITEHMPNLLTCFDWLENALSPWRTKLHEYLNDEQVEHFLIQLVARRWRLQKASYQSSQAAWRDKLSALSQELKSWTEGEPFLASLLDKVEEALSWTQRSSSAVENVNSILKPYLNRKKHFANAQNMENFVALFALWHNLRPFKEGKRKGKSPFEILGVDLGEKDWRNLLGYRPIESS